MAVRTTQGIIARATHARPVDRGRSVRRFSPTTPTFVMLLHQSDSADFRNVLFGNELAQFRRKPLKIQDTPDALYVDASWSTSEISTVLESMTLHPDTSLSCLALEILPWGSPIQDPLGTGPDQEHIFRMSPLVLVSAICLI